MDDIKPSNKANFCEPTTQHPHYYKGPLHTLLQSHYLSTHPTLPALCREATLLNVTLVFSLPQF